MSDLRWPDWQIQFNMTNLTNADIVARVAVEFGLNIELLPAGKFRVYGPGPKNVSQWRFGKQCGIEMFKHRQLQQQLQRPPVDLDAGRGIWLREETDE